MNYDQFYNLSCYEEFEILCTLTGISKIEVLNEFGHKIDNYYFFVSNDGVFNWFDFEGNYIEDPGVLTTIIHNYIPKTITKCIIPNSVTSIDNSAFAYCKSLKSINIPESVTSIGAYVFTDCKSLTSITIPDSVTSIGNKAFIFCKSLNEINMPNSATSIGTWIFSGCLSLKEITIPNSVKSIGECVFYDCKSLKEITIPNSVKSIGDNVFVFCESLKQVIFKGKTLDEVKRMDNYPWDIKDESIIKCEL